MALQEFLASYAVKVDEDGARRLQRILDENRTSGAALASVFDSARNSLTALKKELSDASGLKNIFSALNAGRAGASGPGASGSTASASLSAGSGSSSALSGLTGLSGSGKLSVTADLTAAEEALSDFRTRLEAERPRLQADATGINSAVSSAVAQIRSQLASLRIRVPVTAVATVDTSGVRNSSGSTGSSGSSGKSGSTGSSSPSISKPGSSRFGGITLSAYGSGGRIDQPTIAMIAEEGRPEYVIPTDNGDRAASLLRSFFSELSEHTRTTVLSDLKSSGLIPGESRKASSLDNLLFPANGSAKNTHPESDFPAFNLSDPETGRQASGDGEGRTSPEKGGSSFGLPARNPSQSLIERNELSGLQSIPSVFQQFTVPRLDSEKSHPSARLESLERSLPSALTDMASLRDHLAAENSFSSLSALADRPSAVSPVNTVQAPVNIYVTGSTSPENTGYAIYDTTRRALLKTLKGVFT